jgi:hypothetical protein
MRIASHTVPEQMPAARSFDAIVAIEKWSRE